MGNRKWINRYENATATWYFLAIYRDRRIIDLTQKLLFIWNQFILFSVSNIAFINPSLKPQYVIHIYE